MKPNELMVGDIVLGKRREVLIIEGIHLDAAYHDAGMYTNLYELTPIPVTNEILKANGFVTNNDRTLNGCCIYHRLCGKYDEYKVTIKLLNGFITIESFDDRWYTLLNLNIQLRFVHELQNILRLCKLDELADNFKLK